MRVGTPGFVPTRLTEARYARRIKTQKMLADVIGVGPSTVSRWEKGEIAPEAEMLSTLATTLRVRREFFLRPSFESSHPMFHRQLTNTLAGDLKYQHSQMNWLKEISSVLQHYVDFPKIDIPDVLGNSSWKQLRDEDIERIALDLRNYWQLGEGPCGDIVFLLERIGIIVGTIEMGTSRLDGLCSWSEGEHRPHILLATDKMSFPRRQMDGAHELAHAVLHRHVTDEEFRTNLREIEAQAFRLASAFLMPSTTYPYEVRRPSLATLLSLKERWRVAIKAQIRRLSDLKLIPPEHVVNLYKLLSAKGWNKREPLDQEWPISQPRLLHDATNLIVSSGLRKKEDLLSVEFTISPEDIERLAALSKGWFLEKEGKLVHLKTQSKSHSFRKNEEGTIVEFPHRLPTK